MRKFVPFLLVFSLLFSTQPCPECGELVLAPQTYVLPSIDPEGETITIHLSTILSDGRYPVGNATIFIEVYNATGEFYDRCRVFTDEDGKAMFNLTSYNETCSAGRMVRGCTIITKFCCSESVQCLLQPCLRNETIKSFYDVKQCSDQRIARWPEYSFVNKSGQFIYMTLYPSSNSIAYIPPLLPLEFEGVPPLFCLPLFLIGGLFLFGAYATGMDPFFWLDIVGLPFHKPTMARVAGVRGYTFQQRSAAGALKTAGVDLTTMGKKIPLVNKAFEEIGKAMWRGKEKERIEKTVEAREKGKEPGKFVKVAGAALKTVETVTKLPSKSKSKGLSEKASKMLGAGTAEEEALREEKGFITPRGVSARGLPYAPAAFGRLSGILNLLGAESLIQEGYSIADRKRRARPDMFDAYYGKIKINNETIDLRLSEEELKEVRKILDDEYEHPEKYKAEKASVGLIWRVHRKEPKDRGEEENELLDLTVKALRGDEKAMEDLKSTLSNDNNKKIYPIKSRIKLIEAGGPSNLPEEERINSYFEFFSIRIRIEEKDEKDAKLLRNLTEAYNRSKTLTEKELTDLANLYNKYEKDIKDYYDKVLDMLEKKVPDIIRNLDKVSLYTYIAMLMIGEAQQQH